MLYGLGKGGVNDPLFFESDQNLLGIGLGANSLPRGLYARFDLAKPMRELKVGGNVRRNLSLTTGYMETWGGIFNKYEK